jgi:cyclopropane fatty-acyl-phospholipid synthase-like methyltransferase
MIEMKDRVSVIMEACRGKRVLHLGCTNSPYTAESIREGSLLHSRIAEIAEIVHGLDNDSASLELMREAGYENLHEADLENLEKSGFTQEVDVIVAGEMIEHLSNPGRFLDGVKTLMGPETILLITTINAYSGLRNIQYALRGRGGVNEPVHPDHVAYYSYSTLRLLLNRTGFDIEDFMFYDIGPEHRVHMKWFYRLLNDVCVAISKQSSDGIIAFCRLRDK